MIYILAGTHQQYVNFLHVVGEQNFVEVSHAGSIEDRHPILLLIGTWHSHPDMQAIIARVQALDGQAFGKFGPAPKVTR